MTKKLLIALLIGGLANTLTAMNNHIPVILCKNKDVVTDLQNIYLNIAAIKPEEYRLNVYSSLSSIGSKMVTVTPFFGLGVYNTFLTKKKPTVRSFTITTLTTTFVGGLLLVLNNSIQKKINKKKENLETDYQTKITQYQKHLNKIIGTQKNQQEGKFKKTQLRDFGTDIFANDPNNISKIQRELRLLKSAATDLKTIDQFKTVVTQNLDSFITRNNQLVQKSQKNNSSVKKELDPLSLHRNPSTPVTEDGDNLMYQAILNSLEKQKIERKK